MATECDHWVRGEGARLYCYRCEQYVEPPPKVEPCRFCGHDEQTFDGRKYHWPECDLLNAEKQQP